MNNKTIDDWIFDGSQINSLENLEKVRRVLDESLIIVEHRFYRRSSAPDRMFFDVFEEFVNYLTQNAHPGDHFYIWNYEQVCANDNYVARGKYPDCDGRTPKGGAY